MLRLALSTVVLVALSAVARAQAVLVLWGDSLVCGYGAEAATGTPYGPAPFGEPLDGAWRWDLDGQRWTQLTAQQNHQGTGADLAYGVAAAWRALHHEGEPVYVVALGLPGADVTPTLARRRASWAPAVAGGALERFVERGLRPALATLPAPRVEWMCGSAGNNHVPSWARFQGDLAATWAALQAVVPGAPTTMMLRSYRPQDVEARLAIERSGHAVVDLDILPSRVGGLQPDGVHLTHYGVVCAGIRVGITALLVGQRPQPGEPVTAPH